MKDIYELLNKCADENINDVQPLSAWEEDSIMKRLRNDNIFGKNKKTRKIKTGIVIAATATAISAIGVTAAADSGIFPSLQRIFRTDNPDIPIETELGDIAFIPDIKPIVTDEITINFTEAVADNNAFILCMDVVCDDKILERIPESAYDYQNMYGTTRPYIGFYSMYTKRDDDADGGIVSYYRDGNILSMCYRLSNIEKWGDSTEIKFQDFGYYEYNEETWTEFIPLCEMSEIISIPNEKIKRCETKKSVSEISINEIPVTMELSQFGFTIIGDTDRGDEICENKFFYGSERFSIITKDGRKIDGKELMCSINHYCTDDSYCEYIGFGRPIDVEHTERIEIGENEFVFK